MAKETAFDRYQAALRERTWTWADVPFRQRAGEPLDITPWHDLDYLDVYEQVWGRKVGCNVIGMLLFFNDTATTETENQVYDERFPYAADPSFLEAHGL